MLKFSIQILFITLGLTSNVAWGQTYAAFHKYWDPINSAQVQENHYEAYLLIEEALKYKKMEDTLHYLAGLSAFQLNAFPKAESHLRKLTNTDFEDRHTEVRYLLGEILFRMGRYQESQGFFQTFLGLAEENDDKRELVLFRLEQIQWARNNLNKKDPLIKTKRMDGELNTLENESAPIEVDGSIYYSGLRLDPKDKAKLPKPLGQVFKYNEKNNTHDSIEPGLLESKEFVSNPAFNDDQTLFVYTSCQYNENSTGIRCELFYKRKSENGWGKPNRFPEPVNFSGYSSTQGKLLKDSQTGMDRLYFASNKPGGKGGYDLYTVLIDENGQVSSSENLDFVNTQGNEFTPFFSHFNQTLYFSSDRYEGFGGQDIYKYPLRGKDSLKIINLGPSVNTSYDELGFSYGSDRRTSYMVSNRPGSIYVDEVMQACCYDIYKVVISPATVELLVNSYDAYDSMDLTGVRMRLFDITEGDSLQQNVYQSDKSLFNFKLIEDRVYKLVADKDGFLSDSLTLSTVNLPDLSPLKRQVYLKQIKKLNAFTFEKTTNIALKGVTVQLWDTDNNKLIGEITNPDSNSFAFELIKGRNYILKAYKNKYESAEIKITPIETATENILNRNLFLELSAIAELRRLLPIRLFFDNDMPNPRSDSDTTNVLFSKIYNDYVAKKGIYIKEYTRILRGAAREKAMMDIDTFFEKEVKLNGDKLELFMEKLQIILEEGHEIDIFLKGYSSPRAKSDYNQKLSSRRVNSIRNEFNVYGQSSFHTFIKSGTLEIVEIPFGESKASTDVSDSLEDTRNSIYSLKAAFERRVEILEILKGVDDAGRL